MLQQYHKGLLQGNHRLRFLSNYYEVTINNSLIFCYQFVVEGLEVAEVIPRNAEIFKGCLAKIKELFANKFLFQHHVIYSPIQLNGQMMDNIGALDGKKVCFKLIGEASNDREV